MTVILKQGYTYRTYNTGELPCGGYTQELIAPDGTVYQRSKGTLRTDGEFNSTPEEFFGAQCPEAFESVDDYEIINGKHPLYGDTLAGDCWVQIFTGLSFRAFRKKLTAPIAA